MFKNHLRAVCLAILALLMFCSPALAGLKTLPGHVPRVVHNLNPVGRLAGSNELHLAIGLPLRNQPELTGLLRDLYDSSSTNFHRYLTPAEFTARFGPGAQDYESVIQFMQNNGFAVTRRHGNRVVLDVNGKVSDVERTFHIRLQTYQHPTEGRTFFAPDTEPSVDQGLPVLDISGLSDYGRAKPSLRQKKSAAGSAYPAGGSGPGAGYIGNDFRNAYVPGTSLNGFGQMVGLVQFSGYDPNDIFEYETQAGLPNVPLQNVLLDGSKGDEVANGDVEAEVCLDIEMAIAMAPRLSAVVVFQAPYTNSAAWLNDVLNFMAASNQIKQFSCSWGFSGSPNQTSEQIFQQMAAQGQSFFQASGDGDAWTSPIWEPSESTNITVVGGTTLSMNGTGGSYLSETVWNAGNLGSAWGANGSTNDYWGSGGGVSSNFAIPYWQAGVNMATNLGSTTMRNIPDVAMAADNVYVIHNTGSSGVFEGTSCAAPLWAGFMALVNQQAAELNLPPAGFINPAVYALGAGSNYNVCFHDIVTGSNAWPGSPNRYYAVPGYDLCTGWGTPSGTNLINVLAGGAPDSLTITPLAGFVANGPAGGPFSGTSQTFNLINNGSGSVNWGIVSTSAWLTVSQASGSLSAGSQTNVMVSLASPSGLPARAYSAAVLFTNFTTHASHSRVFTLRIGQSLVQDGGFESGSFSYWMLSGRTDTNLVGGVYIFNGVESPHPAYNPVHSGNYGAFLGDSSLAVLYQLLPTYPAQKYLISFWLYNPVGGAPFAGHMEQFQVNWNTNSPATNTIYSLLNPPAFGWTNLNFVVTAMGTNTVFQVGALNQPDYFGLDDVSVLPIPQPALAGLAKTITNLTMTWITLPNVGYVLQYNTNLTQTNWINLGAATTATTNTLTLTDTNAFTSSPQRFYRLSVGP